FSAARTFSAGDLSWAVGVGDFNADGRLDLAVANRGGIGSDAGSVSVLLGNGDGSFGGAREFGAGHECWSVATGDFDGDSRLDLAVANYGSGTVSVLLGKGDGSFPSAPSFSAGDYPRSVAVSDFNGDGIPDLAVAKEGNFFGGPVDNEGVSVLLGKG